MATQAIEGRKGLLYIGTDKIGEIREWTLSLERETVDATSKDSAGWREHLHGFAAWTVSAEALHVDDDVAQLAAFNALDGDDNVTLNLYPDGNTLGDRVYTGDALVISWELSSPLEDAHAVSLEFQGTGVLTRSSVA